MQRLYLKNNYPSYDKDTGNNGYADYNRILVAVDGSMPSIRALDYASHVFLSNSVIYVLYVIEWQDDYHERHEEYDAELIRKMEKEGRLVLSSILKNQKRCERIIKIGNPANKIIKTANDLNVDIIVLGTKGLGHSTDLGHVTKKILSESNKPVLLLN